MENAKGNGSAPNSLIGKELFIRAGERIRRDTFGHEENELSRRSWPDCMASQTRSFRVIAAHETGSERSLVTVHERI
jgi:hypothetical protein